MKRILEVQKEIGVLGKDAKNPFFKSAYLDLNKLLIHVTPLLHKHGLVLMQPLIGNAVHTQVLDSKTNDVICESCLDIPESLTDPQKIGSCISYFRRYTLKSLLAIPEGDDDANLTTKLTPIQAEAKKDNTIYTLSTVDVQAWNGKIYENHFVYVGTDKKRVSKEQLAKLKKLPKYTKS